ncbi:unnamed protein product [Auanema sp. JU1783]|nr:unnamed protein product [Auanema sp. JU1783]
MDEDSMYYDDENGTSCEYLGTEFIEGKIYLIGVFATMIAILSIVFNTFFTIVFLSNRSIRKSSVFYFGILAVLDTIMAFNYLAVMSLPVYMDYYQYVPVYHVFLSYFRLILTESNWAIFSSMLLILLATTERLLRTFDGEKVLKLRRFLERHRPSVSLLCILIAVPYKACVYWEISVSYKPHCESEFSKYEIVAGPFALIPEYNFWWMFITRNVVDRILPFFLLVAMNYTIFMTLKKDYKRSDGKSSIHEKNGISLATNRRSLRDATRALISIVSMYLMSQFPQVLLTFWETFDKESLVQLNEFYSYLNDILSILTLLSR